MQLRVGMEASGHARWFERLLQELGGELIIGDAAQIRTKRVRKQKTDRQDAQLLLRLLLEDRFPSLWVPDAENRDLRQLLWHRHRQVQMRTRVMNQLHVVALNALPLDGRSSVCTSLRARRSSSSSRMSRVRWRSSASMRKSDMDPVGVAPWSSFVRGW